MKKSIIAIVMTLALGALVAWAGSHDGARLGPLPAFAFAVALAFVVQWSAYIHAQINRTEEYFDLVGSLTYAGISLTLLLTVDDLSPRGLVLGLMVMVWALRLGPFLYLRIRKDGGDSRFDERKKVPIQFFNVWNIQGLWVTFTASAAWIGMTSAKQEPIGWLFYLGIALWAFGFVIEVTADVQKRIWRSRPGSRGRFITTGLWSWSQHPNYFGEIMLWLGTALVALPNFVGWQHVGILSPVFVTVLLTKVSGIPILDKQGEERWGTEQAYRDYRERTSILIPLPPATRPGTTRTAGDL